MITKQLSQQEYNNWVNIGLSLDYNFDVWLSTKYSYDQACQIMKFVHGEHWSKENLNKNLFS